MKVLILYVIIVLIGGFISYEVGLFVEKQWGSGMSLLAFLALFFANFVISWIIAVAIIERMDPSASAPPAT